MSGQWGWWHDPQVGRERLGAQNSGTEDPLYGVWGADANNVRAVGEPVTSSNGTGAVGLCRPASQLGRALGVGGETPTCLGRWAGFRYDPQLEREVWRPPEHAVCRIAP